MLYVVAFLLAMLCGTVSCARIGARRTRSIQVDPINFGQIETRQTFNVDPNLNDEDDLNFPEDDSTPTILGLSYTRFAVTITFAVVGLGTLIWLCYRSRQRRKRAMKPDPEFSTFNANWMVPVPHNPYILHNAQAPPIPPRPPVAQLAPAPPPSRLSILKQEQVDAIPHYGDTHMEPDVLVRTAGGLQLLPGPPPQKKKGYRPFWRTSNGSNK
ncbi:hypothetical protein K438DRAFT_1849740 [Mycena galopus ATCC 62051]|nr:hypothetical protein K438DRAFT_1849740 [Mycena galopus ATCC 62051]